MNRPRTKPPTESFSPATGAYVGTVVVLAVLLGAWALWSHTLRVGPELLVFIVLTGVVRVVPDVVVGNRVLLAISSIVMIAAQALLGPAGAVVVGLFMGVQQGFSWRGRLFNAAQSVIYGCAGAVAFLMVGGTLDPDALQGVTGVVLHLGLPLLVCDVVQLLTNLVLLAGVMRVSGGIPMRLQILSVLRSTGPASIGFGVIAFLMVVLWRLADLGPVSVVIVLAPLLVAQWVYRQRAEELEGQQRALEVLVAALEAKAPHLTGHSARVAELSGHMAQGLGLSPQQVSDTRMAGMLHDVGQTSLSTRVVRDLDLIDTSGGRDGYPEAGVALLDDLTFLRGALDPIRWHREALGTLQSSLPSRIVALADRYDLLTTVGSPGGAVQASALARDLVAAEVVGADAPALIRALDEALARVRSDQSPT